MATDDARFADRLDRFLDTLAEGTDPSPNGLPQPAHELAETVRRLRAFDDAPTADPRFADRLLEEIMHTATTIHPASFPPLPSLPAERDRSDLAPARPRFAVPRLRWVLAQLATAALLVLALGAVSVTFLTRPQRSVMPAVVVPASPTTQAPSPSEVTVTPLVAVTLQPEEVPTGRALNLLVGQGTIEPGAEVAFTAADVKCCAGPQIDHVLSGELTLRSEGPVRVVRAAVPGTPGVSEEAPPGTDVVLRPGESAIHRAEAPFTYVNAGTDPVQLASGGLFRGQAFTQPAASLASDFDSVSLESSQLTGPLTLVLEAATLAPDATLPEPPPGTTRVITAGSQFGAMARDSGGAVTNITDEPLVTYALSLVPTGAAGGSAAATPTP
jgi:hypothetical protein